MVDDIKTLPCRGILKNNRPIACRMNVFFMSAHYTSIRAELTSARPHIDLRGPIWYPMRMELYHCLNRGVDKRTIFLDDADRKRFVHGLEIFNDVKSSGKQCIFFSKTTGSIESIDLRGRYEDRENENLSLIFTDGASWATIIPACRRRGLRGGLTKFLMKLNVGYAKYFNKRYERTGTLFKPARKRSVSNPTRIFAYPALHPSQSLDFLKGASDWRDLPGSKTVPPRSNISKDTRPGAVTSITAARKIFPESSQQISSAIFWKL